MGLTVSYKSIYHALSTNANTDKREIREKILTQQFFISYNNMNFYKYVRDVYIFN